MCVEALKCRPGGAGKCRKNSKRIGHDPFLTGFDSRFAMRNPTFSNACARLNRMCISWMISPLTRCSMLEARHGPSGYTDMADTNGVAFSSHAL